MRKRILAGNWKMNTTLQEGIKLATEIQKGLPPVSPANQIILFPPFISLEGIKKITGTSIGLGAQNCHWENSGAFTGEISPSMIKSIGAGYVIIGHSERRQFFGDTDELTGRKVKSVIAEGLVPVFCCGEDLNARESEMQEKIVSNQIRTGLFNLDGLDISKVIIAYEPVWAIGTGKVATPDQARIMHQFIRGMLIDRFGQQI